MGKSKKKKKKRKKGFKPPIEADVLNPSAKKADALIYGN